MYQKKELQVKKAPSFKILLKVFFHANKKSIFLTSIISFLMFTSITTLVMTWHTNQYNCMINYFEQYDWNNDYELSAYSAHEQWSTYPENLIDDVLETISKEVNEIIPGIIHQKTSGLLSTELYAATNKAYEVCTFTDEINNLMNESITVGRIPQTYNEVIYLQKKNETLFQLDDVISLNTSGLYPSATNFTIVGIIKDVDTILYQEGYSKDVLRWEGLLNDSDFSFENKHTFEAMFYTSKQLLKEISLLDYGSAHAIVYDLNYDVTKIKLNALKKYINSFDNMHGYWSYRYINDDGHSSGVSLSPFWDITNKLEYFNSIMRKEALRIMVYFLPIMVIMMFTLLEGINYSKKTFRSSFWLMKSQGVEEEHLRKIIKLKAIYLNLIIGGTGIILSVILGSVLLVPLNPEVSLGKYLSGLVTPLLSYVLLLVFSVVIFIEYSILRNYLKTTQVTRSERYTEKPKKLFKRILFTEEVLIFLPGLLFFSLGLTGLILLNYADTIISDPIGNFQNSYTIFWTFFLTGIFCLSITILSLVVKLILFICQKISKINWKNRKNFISLSLKSSNHNFSAFRNMLLIFLLAGITIYPGIIFGKSSNEQITIESNLALGCSDILVSNWNYDVTLKEKIETLPNVQSTAEVTKYHYEGIYLNFLRSGSCELDILALHNLTEFNQVVDFSRINSEALSEAINLLQEQQSFLVDDNFAKRNNYFEGMEIYSTEYWHPENELLLNYVGSYDYFPLLTQMHTLPIEVFEPTFNMVMEETTAQLLSEINHPSITPEGFLLIKTNVTNTNVIKELLIENYDLNVKISTDIFNELDIFNTNFRKNFLISLVILTSSILLLLGFIVASNTYQNNIQAIEAAYRVGATKRQILINHLLELLLVILSPILFSVVGGFFLQKVLSSFLYDSPIAYNPIELWIPYWLIGVVLFVEIVCLMLGWSLKFFYDLKSYQPIRQE